MASLSFCRNLAISPECGVTIIRLRCVGAIPSAFLSEVNAEASRTNIGLGALLKSSERSSAAAVSSIKPGPSRIASREIHQARGIRWVDFARRRFSAADDHSFRHRNAEARRVGLAGRYLKNARASPQGSQARQQRRARHFDAACNDENPAARMFVAGLIRLRRTVGQQIACIDLLTIHRAATF